MRAEFAERAPRRAGGEADERAFTGERLERRALVAAALARNPTVEAARQSWRAALARYRQAGAYDDPMLELSTAPLSLVSSDSPSGYEVGISQRIPLGGKLGAQAALAVAEAEAASSDYEAARLQLALTASQLYDDYFVAVRALAINEAHVELVAALQQNAVSAYETGQASALDALSAEAELAQLEYEAVALATRREVAVAQINALLHRAPDAHLAPPPAELALESPEDAQDLAELPAAGAISGRPDIGMARARVRVERARAEVAEQAFYPDLTLMTSYSSMWAMPEHRWMAGLALNVPLQRGRRHGAVEEAAAMRTAAEHEVARRTDEARAEIAVATLRVAEAREAVRLHEQRLLPLARSRVQTAQAGFVAGGGALASLIEIARDLRTVELNSQVMRAELSKRLAELERALGRTPGVAARGERP
jgi:outer membrane protein TolC